MDNKRAKELLDLLEHPDRKSREVSPLQDEAECTRSFEVRTEDQGDLRKSDLYDEDGWTDAIYCVIPDECSEPSCFVAITKDGHIEMADRNLSCHAPVAKRRTLKDLDGDDYWHRPTPPQLAGLLVLFIQDKEKYTITPLANDERELLNTILDNHAEDVVESYMDGVTDFIDSNFPEETEGN